LGSLTIGWIKKKENKTGECNLQFFVAFSTTNVSNPASEYNLQSFV